MKRSIYPSIFLLAVCLLSFSIPAMAGGGWTRDSGSVFLKLGGTMLSTNYYFDFYGRKETVSTISTSTISLYGEFGVDERTMIVMDLPVYKTGSRDGFGSANGIGDLSLGFMFGVHQGSWPIAVGLLVELPTGQPNNVVQSTTGETFNMPTGDGELNAWLRAGVSHSFWPERMYVSFDAGYNLRSIAVREYTQMFDGGKLTNNAFLQAEYGYGPFNGLWTILKLRWLGPTATPVPGRYSFFGLGEGVQYLAYYFTVVGNVSDEIAVNVDVSGAFSAKAIFGGMNYMAGISYTWK